MIYIKYCKKCRQAFDIAINFDVCPRCRMEAIINKKTKIEGKK